MSGPFVAVLDYGIGNLASAQKAMVKVGADARLVTDPAEARGAAGVVLPGVGAFGPCMAAVRATGLDKAAYEAVERGTPFLGICIGMQLMFESSEEDPGIEGLGILPGAVRWLPEGVKRPQMQWNLLEARRPGSKLMAGVGDRAPWVYFVHSFAPELTDDIVATCDYGGPVAAAAERDHVWAMQFHPEKSGATGLAILGAWVAGLG